MANLKELDESKLSNLIDQVFTNVDDISSVEEAARLLAQAMYETFQTDSKSEFVLSRVFHSFSYKSLPSDIQEAVKNAVGSPKNDDIFLTLLGTYGDKEEWKQRALSEGHRAISLTRGSISKIPMMTRLFQQIGFDLGLILGDGSPGIKVAGVEKSYSVFHVEDAKDSPYIPAQDFVNENGIITVLGTGVMLPTNDVSIFIGFTRVHLDETMASQISTLMSLFWQKVFPVLERGFFS